MNTGTYNHALKHMESIKTIINTNKIEVASPLNRQLPNIGITVARSFGCDITLLTSRHCDITDNKLQNLATSHNATYREKKER